MNKISWVGALVGIVIWPACAANGPEDQTTPTCVGLPTPSCTLPVSEPGFVRAAAPVTDGVSTSAVRYTPPGRFCMSGKLDPGATGMNWGSLLVLGLTQHTSAGTIAAPFTAGARGIAKLRFTLDPAPVAGLTVELSAVQRADCLTIPDCFTTAAFVLMDSGSPTVIEDAGTVTASLDSFRQPSWGDPSLPFDTNLIAGLQLVPEMLPGVVLDYDFCVKDVKFLDAAGSEVSP